MHPVDVMIAAAMRYAVPLSLLALGLGAYYTIRYEKQYAENWEHVFSGLQHPQLHGRRRAC